MSVADNFDYSIPTLKRKDLMSLSTINSNDAKIHPFKKMDTQRDWSVNLYNLDIERSSPKRFGVFTNKVDFINKVDDIDRTNPKLLHFKLDKPEYNLTNADIEKSSPNMGNLKTGRCTNPLEPKYQLPKVEEYPAEVPKFIRDSIDIKDIHGARPRKYFKWATRETFPLDNHGIEGSKPKKKYVRKTKYNNIDYSDLTRDIFKTKRCTNPLDPIYEVKYKNGEKYVYGMIEKSKPQTVYPYTYQDPLGLKTDDINGTKAGSKNRINKFTSQNFEMTTKDIRGCSAGSLKKGITTTRNTNPLVPIYQMPGAVELGGIQNDAFRKTTNGFIKKKTDKINLSRKASSAKPEIRKEERKDEAASSNKIENNDGYELGFNGQLYPEDKVHFNKDDYKRPEPFYGVIHDQYVCPSENPDKRPIIDKQKTENLMSKTAGSVFYPHQSTSISPNSATLDPFATKSALNKTEMEKSGVSVGKQVMANKTARNGFGVGKMTYAQKLDNFMQTNKLKYLGEAL